MKFENYDNHTEEAPQESLQSAHQKIAELLIMHGETNASSDEFRQPGDLPSWRFTLSVPLEVIQKYAAEYDTLIPQRVVLEYESPHRIDESPFDGLITDVNLSLYGIVPAVDDGTNVEPSLDVFQDYLISYDGQTGSWVSDITIEYSKDGRVVGRPATEQDETYAKDDIRRYASVIEALMRESKPMTEDDVERMIRIAEDVVRR